MAKSDAAKVVAPDDENEPGAAYHLAGVTEESERSIVYPADGMQQETAQALLKAAESKGYDASVVEWTGDGFAVPHDVASSSKSPKGSTVDVEDLPVNPAVTHAIEVAAAPRGAAKTPTKASPRGTRANRQSAPATTTK